MLKQRAYERRPGVEGTVSRPWGCTAEQWKSDFASEVVGDPSMTDSVTGGPESAGSDASAASKAQKDEADTPCVVASQGANKCRICGEPFEMCWSDEMEEWMYKNAIKVKIVDGDAANRDTIVHKACSIISNDGTVSRSQLLP